MKTVKAKPTSSKPITLSKASKILSQFVSVENGASLAITAYLRRSSAFFNELNQVHKYIRNLYSECTHKRHKSDMAHSDVAVVENQNLVNESSHYWDNQGKNQTYIKEEENKNCSVGRSAQGPDPTLATNMAMEDAVENCKEKKTGKPDLKAKVYGDHAINMRDQDELQHDLSHRLSREPDHKIDNDVVRESGEKKDKKKKKKDKSSNDIIDGSDEVRNIRIKDEVKIEDVKENEKKHNGSGVDDLRGSDEGLELQNGNIHENRDKKKVNTEYARREETKKTKKDDMEGRQEDGSRALHSKKKRRKKSEDDN